jgi:hypothetical protein
MSVNLHKRTKSKFLNKFTAEEEVNQNQEVITNKDL